MAITESWCWNVTRPLFQVSPTPSNPIHLRSCETLLYMTGTRTRGSSHCVTTSNAPGHADTKRLTSPAAMINNQPSASVCLETWLGQDLGTLHYHGLRFI